VTWARRGLPFYVASPYPRAPLDFAHLPAIDDMGAIRHLVAPEPPESQAETPIDYLVRSAFHAHYQRNGDNESKLQVVMGLRSYERACCCAQTLIDEWQGMPVVLDLHAAPDHVEVCYRKASSVYRERLEKL
jgi:hypothetical protein